MGTVDPRVPPLLSRRPVTIEEVPDEELDLGPRPESPTPSELSRLDEDGLDDTFSHIPVKPRIPPNAPPPAAAIYEAIKKIKEILRPSRGPNTKGYKHADLNMVLRGCLELMLAFLQLYASEGYSEWAKHADIIAKSAGSTSWMSRRIREWTIAFMKDDTNLPTAEYGKFNGSVLEDEDLAQEIHLHLQSV
ncbi:hypothetical protein B0H11DRAFT_2429054 [Mycena galericulata]|nr:hypothetical protein B0H11DRAFT_2429054 [Mycena galericulata]